MKNQKEQQIEALKTAHEYIERLRNGIDSVILELREERKEDTEEFLDQVIKGINWVIQVTNGTASLINEKETYINKEETNEVIISLNNALTIKNELEVAEILEKGVIPFLNKLSIVAREITGITEN